MKQSTRISLSISVLTLFVTLSFQQCAPADFATQMNTTQSKAESDQPASDEDAPPEVVEVVEDPDVGEVPMVECPVVEVKKDCKDKSDDEVVSSQELVAQHHSSKKAKDMCAVLCHRPPGNAEQAKTLYLPLQAAKSHLLHHDGVDHEDTMGACEDQDQAL